MTDDDEIISKIKTLSPDAFYIVSREWFGQTISFNFGYSDSILAEAKNKRQVTAFNEIMAAGFCYLDTERGIVGYRSTRDGKRAHFIIKSSEETEETKETTK